MSIPSLNELVRNPWFQFVGFLVGIAGILIAIVTFILTRRYKQVWYRVRSFSLVRGALSTLPGLQVLFENKPVNALTISKIVVWNSGNETIRLSDLPEKERLSLQTVGAVEILEAFILQVSTPSCGVSVRRIARDSFGVGFDFLDPRDGFVIQLAHTGNSSHDVKLMGRIMGRGRISRRAAWAAGRPRKSGLLRARQFLVTRIITGWGSAMIGVFLLILPWTGVLGKIKETWPTNLFLSFLGLLYGAVGISNYRNDPPKGLESYRDDFDAPIVSTKLPIAPQFDNRDEAAEWVIKQARKMADTAQFKVTRTSETELDFDFRDYWILGQQLRDIVTLGKQNGFKITCHGRGLVFVASEDQKSNRS